MILDVHLFDVAVVNAADAKRRRLAVFLTDNIAKLALKSIADRAASAFEHEPQLSRIEEGVRQRFAFGPQVKFDFQSYAP